MRLAAGIPTGRYPFAIAVVLSLSATFVTDRAKPAEPDDLAAPSPAAVSGDGQGGTVGSTLPDPLVVRATDPRGKGLRRSEVRFTVTSGGGSALAGVVLTDAHGYARDFWTLGTAAGEPQRMEARLVSTGELLGTFTASARAGPATRIVALVGDGQTAHPGDTVPIAPAVVLTDYYGNPVPGAVVTFAISGGGGGVSGATPGSDTAGIARVGSWTLGPAAGSNTLTATAAGSDIDANPVTFKASAGSNFWAPLAPLPTSRVDLATGTIDGIAYAVGGETADSVVGTLEAFDPLTATWTPRSALPTPRSGLAVGVVNGVLYAVGGWDGAGIVGTVEAYDPATGSWTAKAPLPTPRTNLAVAVVNGVLYAIGGEGVVSPTSLVCYYPGYAPAPRMPWTAPCAIVEAYDPATDKWSSKAPMSLPRVLLGAGVLNDRIYAVGGETPGHVSWHKTVEVYDPASDTWATAAPMRTGRSGPGIGIVNGLLYAVGGEIPGALSGALEAYDPATNAWIRRAPMPTPRSVPGVAVVNDVLYAVGGNSDSGSGNVEVYQP